MRDVRRIPLSVLSRTLCHDCKLQIRGAIEKNLEPMMCLECKNKVNQLTEVMKVSKDEWREKAIKFLNARNFPKGYCHLKRRPPEGGMPKEFGVVFPANLCLIYLLDELGTITDQRQEWKSLDDMFDAGWDVD